MSSESKGEVKRPRKSKAEVEKKIKKEVKKKKETKKNIGKEQVKTENKTQYSKIGQRYMTPPQGDATRGFYESLYEENPNSLIAIKFLVEYGVLGGTQHAELYAKYIGLQKNNHFKGAVGAIKPNAVKFLEKYKPENIKIKGGN